MEHWREGQKCWAAVVAAVVVDIVGTARSDCSRRCSIESTEIACCTCRTFASRIVEAVAVHRQAVGVCSVAAEVVVVDCWAAMAVGQRLLRSLSRNDSKRPTLFYFMAAAFRVLYV